MNPKQFSLNLKARIALSVLLLFLVSIWLLAYVASTQLKEGFADVLANQQFSYVTQSSIGIEGQIQARFDALERVAQDISPALLADANRLEDLLESKPLLLSFFSGGVFVISRAGVGVADYPEAPLRRGASFSDLEYFQEVMATGKPALGKARIGRFTSLLGVAFAVPVRDQKQQVIGVFVGVASLSDHSLFANVMNAKIGKSGWMAVSDARHRIIVAINDTKRLLQPFPKPGVNVMLDKFAAGYEGSGISTNSQGREVLSSAKQIGHTGWFVQAVLPTDEAYEPIVTIMQRIYLLAIVISVVAMFVVWFLIRRLLHPLETATSEIRRMAMGEQVFGVLPVARQDEVGSLLNTFNILFEQRSAAENALREREQRLAAIIENEPECIKVVDAAGTLMQMNPAGLRMVEAEHAEQVVGQRVLDVIAPEFREAFMQMHQRVIAGEPAQLAFDVIGLQGGRRHMETHAVPMLDNGQVVHLAVTRDMSAQKAYENSLKAAKAAAEAANLAKSAFLATMSHEIRTPMNGILGMAQLLLMPGISEAERLEFARTVHGAGETLLRLLNDILDLSKVEAGKLELSFAVFAPRQIVEETSALFAEHAHAKGLQMEAVWLGSERQRYWGDAIRLRQMISNLLSNAIKFTERGRIRLEGRELTRRGEEVCLEFSVTDTGIGIPIEKQSLLFMPFSQVDASSTRAHGGTGLGLSIIRSLAALMGGEAGVESQPGVGSRFWFTACVRIVEEGVESRQVARDERGQDQLENHCALVGQILVVEDNLTNRRVVSALLGKLGLTVRCVENGEEALAVLTGEQRPDLVLMDVQMPVMDGIRATELVREHELAAGLPRLPIIALTAGAYDEDRQHCLDAGMDDFLTKPISLGALEAMLRKWLA